MDMQTFQDDSCLRNVLGARHPSRTPPKHARVIVSVRGDGQTAKGLDISVANYFGDCTPVFNVYQ